MNTILRMRYRLLPDHWIGELLSKRWIDDFIPICVLLALLVLTSIFYPQQFGVLALTDLAQQASEICLLVLGLTIVVMAGGIDLSVGSVFALSVLSTLVFINGYQWPIAVAIPASLAIGAFCGLANGLLIGYLRLRAFLTTLITLIIFRSVYNIAFPIYGTEILGSGPVSPAWDYLAFGNLFGLPPTFVIAAVVVVLWHIVLTRTRPGWRLTAVGGSRRSAYNIGVNVKATVCVSYVCSGFMSAASGILYAARTGSAGSTAGAGLELIALTAVLIGGISIGGSRGSVLKALLGSVIVLLLTNMLINLNFSGAITTFILGVLLLASLFVDMKWVKHRHRILGRFYLSPTYFELPARPDVSAGSGGPYQSNDALAGVEAIGLGEVEGPEDIILDRQGNLYCGDRHGQIIRFSGPDHSTSEVFAHIGGHTLGLAFDANENLIVCVAGMGLYSVAPDRHVTKLTDRTRRSMFSIIDDAQLRMADDLCIAPDGRIFFSEATIRYDIHNWADDSLESRGNGRILCYDPARGTTNVIKRGLLFPNGLSVCSDGQSFLFAETWACRVSRYYFDGPRAGRCTVVRSDLPGYPDNINPASDGTHWIALAGMRTPTLDLAQTMPGFRKRMARRVAPDAWLYPNLNMGCIVRISEDGEVIETLWDRSGRHHPMVTSMREHDGFLYIGGISNNRIGRIRLARSEENLGRPVAEALS